LNDLKSTLAPFGSEIKFYPRYMLWRDSAAERNGFPTQEPMCIGNGRYCEPEPYSGILREIAKCINFFLKREFFKWASCSDGRFASNMF